MILREALHHLIQRDDSRGCDDPCLAHAPSQYLAQTVRFVDEVRVPAEHRTDRRA